MNRWVWNKLIIIYWLRDNGENELWKVIPAVMMLCSLVCESSGYYAKFEKLQFSIRIKSHFFCDWWIFSLLCYPMPRELQTKTNQGLSFNAKFSEIYGMHYWNLLLINIDQNLLCILQQAYIVCPCIRDYIGMYGTRWQWKQHSLSTYQQKNLPTDGEKIIISNAIHWREH